MMKLTLNLKKSGIFVSFLNWSIWCWIMHMIAYNFVGFYVILFHCIVLCQCVFCSRHVKKYVN